MAAEETVSSEKEKVEGMNVQGKNTRIQEILLRWRGVKR